MKKITIYWGFITLNTLSCFAMFILLLYYFKYINNLRNILTAILIAINLFNNALCILLYRHRKDKLSPEKSFRVLSASVNIACTLFNLYFIVAFFPKIESLYNDISDLIDSWGVIVVYIINITGIAISIAYWRLIKSIIQTDGINEIGSDLMN